MSGRESEIGFVGLLTSPLGSRREYLRELRLDDPPRYSLRCLDSLRYGYLAAHHIGVNYNGGIMDRHEVFFQSLAERKRKENDLSDVYFALLRSNGNALSVLYEVFGLAVPNQNTVTIRREFTITRGSRVDLMIDDPQNRLFVENKKWDRNLHARQYAEAIRSKSDGKNTRLLLVTAYPLQHDQKTELRLHGWKHSTWTELVNHNFPDDTLWAGFQQYVKEVCEMPEIGPIRFEPKTLVSLYWFNNLVYTILESADLDGFRLTIDDDHEEPFADCWSGHWFRLKFSRTELIAFLGIVYFDDPPRVVVEFTEDDSPNFFKYHKQVSAPDGEYYACRTEGDLIRFSLHASLLQILNESHPNKQREILLGFLSEVCSYVKRFLEERRAGHGKTAGT